MSTHQQQQQQQQVQELSVFDEEGNLQLSQIDLSEELLQFNPANKPSVRATGRRALKRKAGELETSTSTSQPLTAPTIATPAASTTSTSCTSAAAAASGADADAAAIKKPVLSDLLHRLNTYGKSFTKWEEIPTGKRLNITYIFITMMNIKGIPTRKIAIELDNKFTVLLPDRYEMSDAEVEALQNSQVVLIYDGLKKIEGSTRSFHVIRFDNAI